MWSRDENGIFWLVFPNKHALPKDEINKIFSLFGTVNTITQAGDERGFRFVSYGSMEEVECAVRSLKTHPLINLIPHRPKNRHNKTAQSPSTPNEENSNVIFSTNQVNTNFFQRKRNNGSINVNQFSNTRDSIFCQEFNSVEDNRSVHSNDARNKSSNFQTTNKSIGGSASSLNSLNRSGKIDARGNLSNSFDLRFHTNDSVSIDIPDLVTKDNIKIESHKPNIEILNAEEVIVANIHDDYGPAYILHLFDDFEPLSISYIKSSPNNCIRYCHVYFTTANDSVAVEKKFDKYNLDGKNLVVFRINKLIPGHGNKIN